jgi:flavin reductase (DIM6/NTAB) family NADH-FMN oxidoreductase RutF/rubredoxin
MINYEALYGISYGLYIVSSGNSERANGFISNTVFQITAQPPQFAICSNRNNFTSELIADTGFFAVSILETNTPADMFSDFGYKSGRDIDKLKGRNIIYTANGVPVVTDHCISYLECRVFSTIDVGTHLMFLGTLLHSEFINAALDPITYQYYREVKKGLSPKNAPTYVDLSAHTAAAHSAPAAEYKCEVCGYIYNESDEDTPFADLPADWHCPLCGVEKEYFRIIT